jgi:uncharacterized protein
MLIYEASKKQFLLDGDSGPIEDLIHTSYQSVTGRKVGPSEIRSWKESLRHMSFVLRDEEIPESTGVAVELLIKPTAMRVDMTLTGYGANNEKNAIIIELKQWEKIKTTTRDAVVETFIGGSMKDKPHPSYQAWSYVSLIEGFNEAVHKGDIYVHSCAYLHNYERDGLIDSPFYAEHTAKAPLFLKGNKELLMLREFIKKYVKHGDNKKVLYELDGGKIRPSKDLANSLVGLMEGNPEFVLIDDQKLIFEKCVEIGSSASHHNPQVIIVEGGPGTGKSVLAINILVELTSQLQNCRYVSKNSAPRDVYQSKLARTMAKTKFSNFFTGSGAYINATKGAFDTLIVDEAHRLNEKSGLYGNLGNNQVKELIDASNCSIFFIDEDQRIALTDIGRKETIREFAAAKGATVTELSLSSQFRCAGSDGYIAWLDNTLAIRPTANIFLSKSEYEFQVFDTATAMHDAIEAKNTNNKARVVAGYCWPWKSKKNPALFDITIEGDYARRWNLSSDKFLWLIAKSSINEVGCIHTCQGLEVEYIGVIIGPDLIVRNGLITTQPSARDRYDKTLRGFKKLLKEDPINGAALGDLIVKNTYRTLMTRGMKGCYIYCTDEETRDFFKSRLSQL